MPSNRIPGSPGRGLYAITDAGLIPPEHLIAIVEQAILGGAQVVQYRDKSGNQALRLAQARFLNKLCREYSVPLIVNDDLNLALEAGTAGVHLGKDDPALADARKKLGKTAVIGVSCYDRLDLALNAVQTGADYVAFGSFFPSPTKPAAVRADERLLRQARRALDLPIVAIGGLSPQNAGRLVELGADYLAVISGVFAQEDVRAAARAYAKLYE